MEVLVEGLNLGLVVLKDLIAPVLINEDAAKLHFEDRALKILGELVGRVGLVVELGFEDFEDLEGNCAIEAVV